MPKATRSKKIVKDKVTKAKGKQDEAREEGETRYWLIKGEAESRIEKGKDVKFDINDLEAMGTSCWEGVRNYEARNILRDKMKVGDLCFFYHSNCKPPGIAGICKVVREGYPDHFALDNAHPYYDAKSDKESPKWFMVDVAFERKVSRFISLYELKEYMNSELGSMALLHRGRLSIGPVKKDEWDFILSLESKVMPDKIK